MQPPRSRSVDGSRRLGYRPALDGLRAVAVLAVFAYHATRSLPGGYLGVDVFFVLSGYLITSLLLVEHEATGRIDVPRFWLARARRLLPALLLLLLATTLWVRAMSPAFELPARRQDVIWTLLYVSNWHFIQSGQSYFTQMAGVSPLRHTWTLGIEEQFYLVWPGLILAALWMGRRRTAALVAVCAVGIAGSAVAMALLFHASDPSRAYYGTGARAHQLLTGALLAILVRRVPRLAAPGSRWIPVLSVLAGCGIAAAFFLLNDHDPLYYRGGSAVFAVLVATFIWTLEARPAAASARLLSLPPARWLGRISYGVYLWYWPVLLAVGPATPGLGWLPSGPELNLVRLALVVSIAASSYYLVERPIRRGRLPGRPLAMAAPAAAMAVWLVATTLTSTTVAGAEEPAAGCSTQISICVRYRGPPHAPVIALVGGSVARSLDGAFLTMARQRHWTYVLAAADGCRLTHLLTWNPSVAAPFRACYEGVPRLLATLVQRWHPSLIVATDRWESQDFILHGRVVHSGSSAHIAAERDALGRVTRTLTAGGAELAYIQLIPRIPPECFAPMRERSPSCRIPVAGDPQAPYNAILRRLAAHHPRVAALSLDSVVCPGGTCTPIVRGRLLRYDGLHFNRTVVSSLEPVIYRELRAAGALPGRPVRAPRGGGVEAAPHGPEPPPRPSRCPALRCRARRTPCPGAPSAP